MLNASLTLLVMPSVTNLRLIALSNRRVAMERFLLEARDNHKMQPRLKTSTRMLSRSSHGLAPPMRSRPPNSRTQDTSSPNNSSVSTDATMSRRTFATPPPPRLVSPEEPPAASEERLVSTSTRSPVKTFQTPSKVESYAALVANATSNALPAEHD